MSVYICPFPECKRRFKEEAELQNHFKRRHNDLPKPQEEETTNSNTESPKVKKLTKKGLKQQKEELLAQEKEMEETLGKLEEQKEEITISMNDIIKSQKKLTPEFLTSKTACDNLEDITQLILREEDLYHFDDTPTLSMDDLCNIEYLALSHNKLTLVAGISKLANLLELNINFNLVEDITPLNECLNLEKLFASNNRIKTISGIRDLTRLKSISLTENKIQNFEETATTLALFPDLKELDLDRNPCTRKFTYKYDLLYYVKVEKLDGDRINPIDYDLAKSFKGEDVTTNDWNNEEEQEEGNNDKPEPSALQRPSTAPGRVKQGKFASQLKKRIEYGNITSAGPLHHIPENVNTEKMAEIEQENDVLKERINQLEVELEESRGNERIMKLEHDKLKNQVTILNVEAQSAYILADQNQQLKKELQSLKVIFSNKDQQINSHQENMLLHEQIAELIKENNELKLKLEKKNSIENNPPPLAEREPKDRVIRKKERILPESRNSSVSQEKSSFIIKSVQPSPKASLGRTFTNTRISPAKPMRNTSEGRKTEELPSIGGGRSVLQESSGRKIIRVTAPQRVSTPTIQSRGQIDTGDGDDELSDTEIEQLLIRSSLQLTQLRSELRDFDFMVNEARGVEDQEAAKEELDDENIGDEQETQDTIMRRTATPKARAQRF